MSYSLSKKFTFSSLIMFTLPTMIMMVIMSLYTIVDGIFVSRYVGTNALSSINIVYPAINVVLGLAIMLSTGGNAIIAKKIGEGKPSEARSVFTMIVMAGVILGIFIAAAGNLLISPIASILGASPVLMKDCITYLSILLFFTPAYILQLLFQTFFVTEGKPGLGLGLTIAAGIVNVIFDYILIVPLDMGIAGAAYATAMGYMVPAIFGILYFIFSKKALYFVKPVLSLKIFLNSCGNGSSEMVSNISSGVITYLFNLLMMKFAGEDGVAAITIIQYAQFLLSALFIGFAQGIAPVISYNHGSQNHSQLQRIFKDSLIFIAVTSVAAYGIACLFGDSIVAIFAQRGSNVYNLAQDGFFLFALSFLFIGFNLFSSSLFTAFSDGRTSAIISIVRTFGLIVLCLFTLPELIGITGVWLAVPIAEIGGIGITIYYILKYRRKYHYMAI